MMEAHVIELNNDAFNQMVEDDRACDLDERIKPLPLEPLLVFRAKKTRMIKPSQIIFDE